MRLQSFFAPTTWVADNKNDADFSAAPALLSDGQVVATGKSGLIYLLKASHLGGIGGQEQVISSTCGNVLDGGVVVHGHIVYLPCLNGPLAVRVSSDPARLTVVFRSPVGTGPPILAAQEIWSIDRAGILWEIDPNDGDQVAHATIGVQANDFATPSVGDGLLLAANARQVVAFSAK
jgi:hypothetical protein